MNDYNLILKDRILTQKEYKCSRNFNVMVMSIIYKRDLFYIGMCNYRFCKTTLPSDVTVNVGGVKFHLHMVLLLLFPSFVFWYKIGSVYPVMKWFLWVLCSLLIVLLQFTVCLFLQVRKQPNTYLFKLTELSWSVY